MPKNNRKIKFKPRIKLNHNIYTWCRSREADIFVGFTLQAKLVSSRHLIQVHLKISSRGLENLASHLVTKYTLEAQAVNHLSR